ncbi:NADH-quinone oxidoreductase subunit C [Mucisphaera sp.]|uniref:NADH-quinone oxidoreductase subunit C n=1 Tax=Mucisphaera sp. TaxID=2913024 RepID=UPI003D12971A
MSQPDLNHPTLALMKERFSGKSLFASEFRGQTTVVVPAEDLHAVLAFLKEEAGGGYALLSDIAGVDYLDYPKPKGLPVQGRFGVIYNLVSPAKDLRLFIKTYLEPTVATDGIEEDPALYLDSVTDLWPGAEWLEREVFDMFGIRFRNHPDLRRILLWEKYPAHPLRKDYPVRGRGERETFRVVDRDSA